MAPRWMAAALACVLAVGCANPFSSEPEPTARDLLSQHAAATDQPAIAVPTTLPDGYRMLWANMYFPEDHTLPGVEVCVARRKKELRGGCLGTQDPSPWVSFKLDGLIVVLTTVSAPEKEEFLQPWLDAEWTTDWRSVDWIDGTFSDAVP